MPNINKSGEEDGQQRSLPPATGRARVGKSGNKAVSATPQVFNRKRSTRDGLFIDGHLHCAEVHHAKHVTVGRHARVRADIQADTVVVSGQLIGNIYSSGKVSLDSYSRVMGNIVCTGIVIADGARFTGRIDMEDLSDVTTLSNALATDNAVRPHIAKPGIYA